MAVDLGPEQVLLRAQMPDDACAEDFAELEDAVVDDGVDGLCALAAEIDQACSTEDGEVLRY
jgi:hypothetical protein